MIWRFWDVSLSPKTNLIYFWRHQDTSNSQGKNKSSKKHYSLSNLKIYEIHEFESFGKDGHRNTMKSHLQISLESRMWDHFFPERMKWTFW